MRHDNQTDLHLLRYADTDTIERIAAHCPAADAHEIQKILNASERKYQRRRNTNDTVTDSEVFQVAVEKSSYGWRRTWAAAACLLMCAGTVGGLYAMNLHIAPVPEKAETAEIDTIQEETEAKVTPTEDETAPVRTSGLADRVQSAASVTTDVPDSEKDQDKAEDVSPDPADAALGIRTVHQKSSGNTISAPSGTSVNTPKSGTASTQTTTITETTSAETTATETTAPTMQFTPAEYGRTYTAEDGISELPGFRTLERTSFTYNKQWHIEPASMEGDSQILTRYAPTYCPENYAPHISRNAAVDNKFRNNTVYQTERYYASENGGEDISVVQYARGQYRDEMYDHLDIADSMTKMNSVTALIIEGKPGYLCEETTYLGKIKSTLVWDRGDYIFAFSGYDLGEEFAEELVKMAESLQPVTEDTVYDGDISMENVLPSIPCFFVEECMIAESAQFSDEEVPGFQISAQWRVGMPELVEKRYKPTYIPAAFQESDMSDPDETFLNELAENGGSYRYSIYYNRCQEEAYEGVSSDFQGINISQYSKWNAPNRYDSFDFYHNGGIPLTPVQAGAYHGYQLTFPSIFEGMVCYELVLDIGDYTINVWVPTLKEDGLDNEIDEILKMAASMQCID